MKKKSKLASKPVLKPVHSWGPANKRLNDIRAKIRKHRGLNKEIAEETLSSFEHAVRNKYLPGMVCYGIRLGRVSQFLDQANADMLLGTIDPTWMATPRDFREVRALLHWTDD